MSGGIEKVAATPWRLRSSTSTGPGEGKSKFAMMSIWNLEPSGWTYMLSLRQPFAGGMAFGEASGEAELGLDQFDAVIVAITGSLEASILATVLVDRLRVRRIIAK